MEESKDTTATPSHLHSSSYSAVSSSTTTTTSSSTTSPTSPASPPYTHFEHLKHFLKSQWKIFSYERADDLRILRDEIEYCTSAFVLACLYVLVCAIILSIVEGPDDELGQTEDSGPLEEVTEGEEAKRDLENLLDKKKELLRSLFSLTRSATEPPEDEWMSQALEEMKNYDEEVKKGVHCPLPEIPSGPKYDWGILNSFVCVLTVTTSIGYGHIAPSTNSGRALTIVYAIVGIPLFLILLADFGKLFTRALKFIFVFLRRVYRSATCRRVRKKKPVQPKASAETEADAEEAKKLCSQPQEQDKQKAWDDKTGGGGGRGGGGEEEGGGGAEPALTELEDESCCASCLRRIRACFSWMCCRDREADAGDSGNGTVAPTTTGEEEAGFTVDDNFNLPVSLALIILLIYILFGCIIYTRWEDWTYFEAFYFIFISMTTIGFGDYVPQHPAFMMATTWYLLFGLALTAMSINIIQEKLSDTFRTASKKLKESFAYIMAATQGEEGVEGEEDQDGEKPKEVEVAEVHLKQDKKES